jgi:hypothetical protein
MDEDQLYITTPSHSPPRRVDTVSGEWLAERLAELPTRTQMYRLACNRRLPRAMPRLAISGLGPVEIFWSLTAIGSAFAIIFILTRPQSE